VSLPLAFRTTRRRETFSVNSLDAPATLQPPPSPPLRPRVSRLNVRVSLLLIRRPRFCVYHRVTDKDDNEARARRKSARRFGASPISEHRGLEQAREYSSSEICYRASCDARCSSSAILMLPEKESMSFQANLPIVTAALAGYELDRHSRYQFKRFDIVSFSHAMLRIPPETRKVRAIIISYARCALGNLNSVGSNVESLPRAHPRSQKRRSCFGFCVEARST